MSRRYVRVGLNHFVPLVVRLVLGLKSKKKSFAVPCTFSVLLIERCFECNNSGLTDSVYNKLNFLLNLTSCSESSKI
ncbi:hypothetical protein BpHYR1_050910 [Brachionus plicatilis]|uniref:Uncharacterized protein n=1 Tax=Brachionus plicatilis TaxID=10195 RepID=A0A3M7RJJ3_BRAPC|nr:hypothetical protein BpHYR1_050910 [Brachionus plicatilis]